MFWCDPILCGEQKKKNEVYWWDESLFCLTDSCNLSTD